jgi:hypothetical protein
LGYCWTLYILELQQIPSIPFQPVIAVSALVRSMKQQNAVIISVLIKTNNVKLYGDYFFSIES